MVINRKKSKLKPLKNDTFLWFVNFPYINEEVTIILQQLFSAPSQNGNDTFAKQINLFFKIMKR